MGTPSIGELVFGLSIMLGLCAGTTFFAWVAWCASGARPWVSATVGYFCVVAVLWLPLRRPWALLIPGVVPWSVALLVVRWRACRVPGDPASTENAPPVDDNSLP